jgi:hypothetical protein
MEPSESDINQEYEARRLTGLRQLAHEVNDKIKTLPEPITYKNDPVQNPYIDNIEDKNGDFPCLQWDPRARRGISPF